MIQERIPSIQEILSKVRTFSECDPKNMSNRIHFEYNEDGINIKSMKYDMESFDPFSDMSELITAMNKDFADCVQRRYEEEYYKEKENKNMPYNLNVNFGDPWNFYVAHMANICDSWKDFKDKVESIEESDKGLTVIATKQAKSNILPRNLLDILSKIKDYKIYNGKALVVWFTDGSFTKAVVSNGDEFDFYTGLMICLFKKYLGENGSKKFNKMMEVAMKKLGDIDKNKEKQAEEKVLAEKKRRKADMKRKAKALKRKEEAIDIQKQGFVRAMQEIGEDDRK